MTILPVCEAGVRGQGSKAKGGDGFPGGRNGRLFTLRIMGGAGVYIPFARGDTQLCRDALDHAVRVRVALLASCSKRGEHGVVILPLLLGLGPLDSREQITRTPHRIDARLGLSSLK